VTFTPAQIRALGAVLSGEYTPFDVRELVRLCSILARPAILKKISLGKLSLSRVGLSTEDIVYDCLADLFRRDENGCFIELTKFLSDTSIPLNRLSDERKLVLLRRAVFIVVHKNLIRLYSDADPLLGKVLRNIKVALERKRIFDQVTWFEDILLVPSGVELLEELPPFPVDAIRRSFSAIALVHDSIPLMLEKLHTILLEQSQYQRALPLMTAALLCKELYLLGWETNEEVTEQTDHEAEREQLNRIIECLCEEIKKRFYPTYVATGKKTEKEYSAYIGALRAILQSFSGDGEPDDMTYFDYLSKEFPSLTKECYQTHHSTILDYLVKVAKNRLREILGAK